MLGWIAVSRETMMRFAVSSILSWVCGPPVVPGNNGENWLCMLLASILQCLSPGENQPSFLFCGIISQSGQFPELAHPARTSDKVERALLRSGKKASSSQSLSGSAEVTVELPRAVISISLLYSPYKGCPKYFLVHPWLPPLYPGVLGSSSGCVWIVLTSPAWQKEKQSPLLDMEFRWTLFVEAMDLWKDTECGLHLQQFGLGHQNSSLSVWHCSAEVATMFMCVWGAHSWIFSGKYSDAFHFHSQLFLRTTQNILRGGGCCFI